MTDSSARRNILVTGARRGIGAEIARALARSGAAVMVADIDLAGAEVVAREIRDRGGIAHAHAVDVSDLASVRALFRAIDSMLGELDVIFNNAGILQQQDFLDIDEHSWDATMRVNALGPLLCTQEAARRFIERGRGKIINICSTSSRQPSARYASYAASKAFLLALTQATARELALHGITVNGIGPGIVATDLWAPTDDHAGAPNLDDYVSGIPLGRVSEPSDVAGLAEFLAGPASDYITGQLIMVDGGVVMV